MMWKELKISARGVTENRIRGEGAKSCRGVGYFREVRCREEEMTPREVRVIEHGRLLNETPDDGGCHPNQRGDAWVSFKLS